MTSREALRSYRERMKDRAAHEQVYFFHAHIYYDSSSAEETSKMRDVKKSLHQAFDSDDHVEIHTLQVRAEDGKCQALLVPFDTSAALGSITQVPNRCELALKAFVVKPLQCSAGQGCRTPSRGKFGGPIHQATLHSYVELLGVCAADLLQCLDSPADC